MALVKKTLKELRNGRVQFISLVDRAATRVPFRVLKRDEDDMGIDLTRVKKSNSPVVADIVVFAQADAAVAEQIRQSVAAAGFQTDRTRKADAETVGYAQGPQTGGEVTMIRLGDQVLLGVRNMPAQVGLFAEALQTHGFLPDLSSGTALYHDAMLTTKAEDMPSLLESYTTFVQSLKALPAAVETLDTEITAIVEAATAAKAEAEVEKGDTCKGCGESLVEKDGVKACKCAVTKDEVQKFNPNHSKEDGKFSGRPGGTKDAHPDDTDIDKARRAGTDAANAKAIAAGRKDWDDSDYAEHERVTNETFEKSKGKAKKEEDEAPVVEEKPAEEAAVVVEEPAKDEPVVVKADEPNLSAILDAIKGVEDRMTEQVATLTQKLESVVTKQQEGQTALDAAVKKAETLEQVIKGTVITQPRVGDPLVRSAVVKQDEDPRTGNFDTAFIGRRARR